MDPTRARELLDAERTRIEHALAQAAHQDDAEPADDEDPGNLASDLYQDELDEGLRDDLAARLAAVERAAARRAGPVRPPVRRRRTGTRREAFSRAPYSGSRGTRSRRRAARRPCRPGTPTGHRGERRSLRPQ